MPIASDGSSSERKAQAHVLDVSLALDAAQIREHLGGTDLVSDVLHRSDHAPHVSIDARPPLLVRAFERHAPQLVQRVRELADRAVAEPEILNEMSELALELAEQE